jgi:3-methylfumaryl-CoA hydratase
MSEPWTDWVGRSERVEDRIDQWPAAALTAALGRTDPPAPGSALPAYWHHLYAHPVIAADATGPDGHPARGRLVPPAPGRRMWAGGRVIWHAPLVVGSSLVRTTTVRSITEKEGRSGRLVFVLLEHRYESDGRLAMVEEHDVVYREGAGTGARQEPPADAQWRQPWQPDRVLLFRYSALTYNGHRIHYDQAYARAVEGYPDVVVHGPLLATFLMDGLRRHRPDFVPARFAFRAQAPIFPDRSLHACGSVEGGVARLWIEGPDGELAMIGECEQG